jgi:riboflavin kinase / FMN adenylyltransferase
MPSSGPAAHPFVIVDYPAHIPPSLAGAVVAIGNFDGIHRGHAALIERVRQLGIELNRPTALVTFEPHPADFFAGTSCVFRLTPQAAKSRAVARLGLDGMIVLPFDSDMAALSAEDFVSAILAQKLGITAAVVGYDFQFGKGRSGNAQRLRALAANEGIRVEIIERVDADAQGTLEAVHSQRIRHALSEGDVTLAAHLLGYPWFAIGEVVHGKKLGRTLGFPTANIALDPSCQLKLGIYAVRLEVDGHSYDGVASFGRRPTFDNGAVLLEVFLFDFAGDLYGKVVEVAFYDFIRGEAKFDSVEALVERMNIDVMHAKASLAAHPRPALAHAP